MNSIPVHPDALGESKHVGPAVGSEIEADLPRFGFPHTPLGIRCRWGPAGAKWVRLAVANSVRARPRQIPIGTASHAANGIPKRTLVVAWKGTSASDHARVVYARPQMAPAGGLVDTLDTICFVRWSARPGASEVQRVKDGIITARRSAGRPLVLISCVPENAKMPGREGREALLGITPIVDQLCEAQYAVFHGASIRGRIVRGLLVAVGLAMRSTVEIVDTVETALERAATRLGVDPAVLLTRTRALGIIA